MVSTMPRSKRRKNACRSRERVHREQEALQFGCGAGFSARNNVKKGNAAASGCCEGMLFVVQHRQRAGF
jgi:hypothetical protein